MLRVMKLLKIIPQTNLIKFLYYRRSNKNAHACVYEAKYFVYEKRSDG